MLASINISSCFDVVHPTKSYMSLIIEQVPFAGLDRFSQVFAVGTGATAVPMRSITRPATGEKYSFSPDGHGTDLVRKLLEVQRGAHNVDSDWCWVVKDTREELLGGLVSKGPKLY
jgi:hypothetical protein